jgi:dTDP-4-dehydrorhamnose reductase
LEQSKKKLLITGISGFLGYHLAKLAIDKFEVYGLYNNTPFAMPGITALKCNLGNYLELGDLIEDIEPEIVIHTAALANAAFCQQNPDKSFEINVEATENIAGICADLAIPFVFTSTDLVFDGKKGNYNESDAPNPLNTYAEHKVIAEEKSFKIYPESAIFRLPLMFGGAIPHIETYLHNFVAAVQAGNPQTLFTDEYRSVCGAKSIAQGILQLYNYKDGILHLAGLEKISRFEYGEKICEAFKLDKEYLIPSLQKNLNTGTPRPADVSMDISKAKSLGYNPLTASEELLLIANNQYL